MEQRWHTKALKFSVIGFVLAVATAGAIVTYVYAPQLYARRLSASIVQPTPTPADMYHDFLSEVYDKIQKNYWDKIPDDQLSELFRLGTEKIQKTTATLATKDKAGVLAMFDAASKDQDVKTKKDFAAQLANIVLVNLKPFARSSLYTEEQQQKLYDTVAHIDRSKDLYSELDLPKTASVQAVEDAYQKKAEELKKEAETSPDAKKKLDELAYAKQVLTDQNTKQRYDKTGAEPTVTTHLVSPTVAYIKLDRFSPETFTEFIEIANSLPKKPGLDSLIIDLRNNFGGAIDYLQYFLGPFIGPNQYAYEFFHQGDFTPYKTKYGFLESLAPFKKIVILTNDKSQSSAEVMASALKKYHVGVVVGTTTRGWGTIEQVIPLDHQLDNGQKYSLVLVQSVTIREDGQPIESRGVDPNIKIEKITDTAWQKQLMSYFNYPPLVSAVKSVWSQ